MDATTLKLWKNYNMATNLLLDAMGGASNIVGEFAEKLVAECYEGEQLAASSKSADVLLKDGTTIQVKARMPRQTLTTSLGVIRSWDFDYLVAVLFATDGTVVKGLEMDVETAKSVGMWNKHQNGWVITTTQSFLEHPSARDITDCLNCAMGETGHTDQVKPMYPPKIPEQPVNTEPLYWNEGQIEVKRREHESFQDFVKRTLRDMLNKDLIPLDEINKLQTKEYSKQALGLEYALFVTHSTQLRDGSGRLRYWVEPLCGKYYACNDWAKRKMNIYEPKFTKWIRQIIALNERN